MGFDCNSQKKRRYGNQGSEENEPEFAMQVVVESRK
jgi:hypothetical protein